MKRLNRICAALLLLLGLIPPITLSAAPKPVPAGFAAFAMDAETGITVFKQNADERIYPASTTKIMTALLLLEYADGDYSARVTFSHNAIWGIDRDSSHIAMDEGETLTLEQCLYALLLPSANEVSMAIAEHIGGTVENFADMMNARAASLGCVNTHFMNPHGLHDPEHYTTARDIALIMQAVTKFDKFREVIATPQCDIPPTEKQPSPRPLTNTNKLIQPGTYYLETCLGGKTGFTDEAQHTLVTLHQKDGKELICATMKTEKNVIYTDTAALAEYGFSSYGNTQILAQGGFAAQLTVLQPHHNTMIEIGSLRVVPEAPLALYLPGDLTTYDIEQTADLPETVEVPIAAGEIIGTLRLAYDGTTLATVNLIADESVTAVDGNELANAIDALVFEDEDAEAVFRAMESNAGNEKKGFSPFMFLVMAAGFIAAVAGAVLLLHLIQLRRFEKRRRRIRAAARARQRRAMGLSQREPRKRR